MNQMNNGAIWNKCIFSYHGRHSRCQLACLRQTCLIKVYRPIAHTPWEELHQHYFHWHICHMDDEEEDGEKRKGQVCGRQAHWNLLWWHSHEKLQSFQITTLYIRFISSDSSFCVHVVVIFNLNTCDVNVFIHSNYGIKHCALILILCLVVDF